MKFLRNLIEEFLEFGFTLSFRYLWCIIYCWHPKNYWHSYFYLYKILDSNVFVLEHNVDGDGALNYLGQVDDACVLYRERFMEFLIDLLSQLPARRYYICSSFSFFSSVWIYIHIYLFLVLECFSHELLPWISFLISYWLITYQFEFTSK